MHPQPRCVLARFILPEIGLCRSWRTETQHEKQGKSRRRRRHRQARRGDPPIHAPPPLVPVLRHSWWSNGARERIQTAALRGCPFLFFHLQLVPWYPFWSLGGARAMFRTMVMPSAETVLEFG